VTSEKELSQYADYQLVHHYGETLLSPDRVDINCCKYLRDKFLANTNYSFVPKKYIYLTRRNIHLLPHTHNTRSRQVLNEDDVVKIISKYGFQCVDLCELKLIQKIELFNTADIIMGPWDGGFTLSLCANKNTKIVNIMPNNWHCNFRHYEIICNDLNIKFFNFSDTYNCDSNHNMYVNTISLETFIQQQTQPVSLPREHSMLSDNLFYCQNKDTYPPFKKGLYLEEYFLKSSKDNNTYRDKSGRLYIPALWTNFQIESWFVSQKPRMQACLDQYIDNNPSPSGYFTVVQHDDDCLLKLPANTVVYGSCSGNVPLPLIYQDVDRKLSNYPKKSFNEKTFLCSFVGTLTHGTRSIINAKFINNQKFVLSTVSGWDPNVHISKQINFIETTINSKFTLAPRGCGRSSFRFFEIFQLGSIPVYVWDDIEWLPYKDCLDYTKFCISINIKDIDTLEQIISNISEDQYNTMLSEYGKVKQCFELDYMVNYVFSK
jgi:hypothetical protein